MLIGDLIRHYREQAGLSRQELSDSLNERGIKAPPTTIQGWEEKPRGGDTDWNPQFISALASIFEKTELEILDDLGFNVTPMGYTAEDVEMARFIRNIPNPMKRRRVLAALLRVLELMDNE